MLYKITETNGKAESLDPVPFQDIRLEKDLEDLLANSLMNELYEYDGLFPIFQERQRQAEADLYALNEAGDLIIFELKRSTVDQDAVQQVLRYTQEAGQWNYSTLQSKFHTYTKEQQGEKDLRIAHQQSFGLEEPILEADFNKKQHMMLVGSAANSELVKAVDFWKSKGLSIDFLPYRIYEIAGEKYFEFFAKPYDQHQNPSHQKGLLFDTNESYAEEGSDIWYMIENNLVAAFGKSKRFIHCVGTGDIVFYTHKGYGVVAAAKVLKGEVESLEGWKLQRKVEFLTPKPENRELKKYMSFKDVSKFLDQSFFWARTVKAPYLSKEQADSLLVELNKRLGS